MGDLHKINPKRPRKLGETEWSDNGLRLGPVRAAVDSDWFLPAILMFPLGAFLIVFFW